MFRTDDEIRLRAVAIGFARLLLAAAIGTSLGACRAPRPGRVVVLGICGLPPALVDTAVAHGDAPSFARLYAEGAAGAVVTSLAGLPPSFLQIWTSYATGQLPEHHGIAAFVLLRGKVQRLYESGDVTAPAAWEIASAMGRTVGVVNWPVTYPAQRVNGFVVSDRYLPASRQALAGMFRVPWERDPERVVYPAELRALLDANGTSAHTIPNTADAAQAADRAVIALVTTALASSPADLVMIFVDSFDQIAHLYWAQHDGTRADVVLESLRRLDGLVGDLAGRLDPADHLVVLSDHGMERAATGPLSGEHFSSDTAAGVLVVRGPRIRPGVRITNATILDVLPTILELLGVPAAVDMPGDVVGGVFRAGDTPLPRHAPYAHLPAA